MTMLPALSAGWVIRRRPSGSLTKHSTVSLYLDGDPEQTIDATHLSDLLDPANMEHLNQPLVS